MKRFDKAIDVSCWTYLLCYNAAISYFRQSDFTAINSVTGTLRYVSAGCRQCTLVAAHYFH